MRIISIIIALLLCPTMFSKNAFIGGLFDQTFEYFTANPSKEVFKGQIVKGQRNGIGILRYNNGNVFIGDFYRNKISGYGMLIADTLSYVKNCDKSVVYVGNWENGKKTGYGRCYDYEGNVLYQGMFENDKPANPHPFPPDSVDRSFIISFIDENIIYLGETKNGLFDGYGILVFPSGDCWVSSFKNDSRNGVGIYLTYDNDWEMIDVQNGEYTMISSSQRYKQIDAETAQRKQMLRQTLIGALSDLAVQSAEFSSTVHAVKNGESIVGESLETTSNSFSNGGNYQQMYNKWEKRAEKHYNSLTKSGYSKKSKSKVSGGTGASMNGGNYVAQKRSFRDAQKEMKKIRAKAKKVGVIITQSKWETATINY